MEPAPSSLSYLRAVQQLQKKTEELESVYDEKRRLERENAALLEEKTALVQEVAQLKAQNSEWRSEFGVLEEQVRQQQRHLQEHIEREANRLQTSSAKSRESNAEKAALQQQLSAVETEREETAAKCRRLSRDVAALKRELKAATAKASHYHSTHAHSTAETAAMDEIESRALEGVKSEIASFAAENERLMNALEAERKARAVAEEGVAHLQQLLQRQREVSERQQLLAKTELRALNVQNDALLEDVKRLMERDDNAAVAAVGNGIVEQKHRRRVSTVDRGTVTTQVPYTPLHYPSVQSPQASPLASSSPAIVNNSNDDIGATIPQKRIQQLLEKVRELESMTTEQSLLIREKEANERLLEERAKLHAEERRHLRELLNKATTPEKGADHYDSSHIVRAEADTELSAVLEVIIDLLRTFVNCAARLRGCLSLPVANTDSMVLPIVPCRDHSSPQLNAIFSHLGGLRHVATVIDEIGETATQNIQQQQKELRPQKATTSTVKTNPKTSVSISPAQYALHSKAPHSEEPQAPHSLQAASTKHDINSWLTARQENMKRQLQQANVPNCETSNTPPLPKNSYNYGETLEEAAKEFKKPIYRLRKR